MRTLRKPHRAAMTEQPSDSGDMTSKVVRDRRKTFLIGGTILILAGLLALAAPLARWVGAVDTFTLIGWLFLTSGMVWLVTAFAIRGPSGFWWSLLSGVLGVVAGGWLVVGEQVRVLQLQELVLVVFFIEKGMATVMFVLSAFLIPRLDRCPPAPSRIWTWELMLVSGIVDLILAAVVLLGLQGAGAWVLVLMVVVNTWFEGASLIGMAAAEDERNATTRLPLFSAANLRVFAATRGRTV